MQSIRQIHRGLAASLMLGLGLLQVWDPGLLSSPVGGWLQTLVAVLVPPGAALLSKRGGVWAGVVAASAVLFGLARWTSPRPVPALILVIGFLVAALCLLGRALRGGRSEDRSAAVSKEVRAWAD